MASEQSVVQTVIDPPVGAPARGVSESVTVQTSLSPLDRVEAQLAAQRQQQQGFAQTLVQTRQMVSDSQARESASDWRLAEIVTGAAVLATLLVLAWVRWRLKQTRAESQGRPTKFSPSAFDEELSSQQMELPSASVPIQKPYVAAIPQAELDPWNGMPVVLARQQPPESTPQPAPKTAPTQDASMQDAPGEGAKGPPAALEGEVQKVLRSLAQKRLARMQPEFAHPGPDQRVFINSPSESLEVDIALDLEAVGLTNKPADPVSLLLDLSQPSAFAAPQPELESDGDPMAEENIRSQWEANLYLAQELEKLGQHDEACSMYQEVMDHGDPASRKAANALMHSYPRVNKISG